jgi:acetolactate synthase-1/2/3 large subunit
MARGAFPDSHPQQPRHAGHARHGARRARAAEADLIVALGARFDDRVTGKATLFAPNAQVVHVDIDPAEISKIRTADVPIVGDVREVLIDLDAAFRGATGGDKPDIAEWWSYLDGLLTEFPLGYTQPSDGLMSPQYVISRIGELTGPEGVYAAGVGQHQMWAAQFIGTSVPTRGSTPAAPARWATPFPPRWARRSPSPSVVWAIDGDGCFQMTNQELATCVINDIPIKVAIINNSSLGMVRQWQTLFLTAALQHRLNTGHDSVRIPTS